MSTPAPKTKVPFGPVEFVKLDPASDNIDFAVRCRLGNGDLHVDFEVYQVLGTLGDAAFIGDSIGRNGTTPEEADIYMDGFIKWDGSANWNFTENRRSMIHFCGEGNVRHLYLLWGHLYRKAAELMPEHKAVAEQAAQFLDLKGK